MASLFRQFVATGARVLRLPLHPLADPLALLVLLLLASLTLGPSPYSSCLVAPRRRMRCFKPSWAHHVAMLSVMVVMVMILRAGEDEASDESQSSGMMLSWVTNDVGHHFAARLEQQKPASQWTATLVFVPRVIILIVMTVLDQNRAKDAALPNTYAVTIYVACAVMTAVAVSPLKWPGLQVIPRPTEDNLANDSTKSEKTNDV